jgi:hypothetical protein
LDNHTQSAFASFFVFLPYAQAVENGGKIPAVMNLLVRTAADGQAASEIRRIAIEANPEIPMEKSYHSIGS